MLKVLLSRAFVDCRIDNDEKVTSHSEKHTEFKTRDGQNRYPIDVFG